MRKLLYIIFLLPFLANAQTSGIKVGAPIIRNDVSDAYPTGYGHLQNGTDGSVVNLLSLDSLKSTGYYKGLRRDGMKKYVISVGQDYRYNYSTDLWSPVLYGNVTRAQVDSINNTALHKTGSESKNGDLSFKYASKLYFDRNTDFMRIGIDSLSLNSSIMAIDIGDDDQEPNPSAIDTFKIRGVYASTVRNWLTLNGGVFKYFNNDIIHSGRIGSGLTYSGGLLSATVSQQLQISSGTSGFAGDAKTYTNTGLAGKTYTLFQNAIGRYLLPSEYTVTGTGGFVLTNALGSGDVIFLTTTGLIGAGSGGGSSGTPVVRETPNGLLNGSNTTFTLAHIPISGTESFFRNGVLQDPGTDYNLSGATITTIFVPVAGEKLRISYTY